MRAAKSCIPHFFVLVSLHGCIDPCGISYVVYSSTSSLMSSGLELKSGAEKDILLSRFFLAFTHKCKSLFYFAENLGAIGARDLSNKRLFLYGLNVTEVLIC